MPQTPRKIKIACPSCGQKLDVTDMPSFAVINCPSCSFELIVPKWFNNYMLEAPEGAGGMAVVYRALDIALDREVAIKIFNRDLASKGVSPDLFLHEARIAATINHPAVVPIYSCGEWDGSTYIVMEYMGGGTLERRLKKANGRLPLMETCRWIRDVCEGLDAARELGIIHHDVKPANILLNLDSNVKIADFGLSQAISGKSASAYLDPTQMWLSPQYVSPEKVLTGEENAMGDIYSLGASFYHLLTGQLPFQSDNTQDLVNMRLLRDPVPPERVRPDITPALSAVIMDMMNRDPNARPPYRQIAARINDAVRAIMRPAPAPVPVSTPAPAPGSKAAPQERPGKVILVPANRTARPPVRSSHLALLLILFFLMCSLCFLVFLPRFAGQRTLLDAAPALKLLYGDLPPESFPFLSESFYDSPMLDADFAVFDPDLPLPTRCAAAWVSGMCNLLDDIPSAVQSISDSGDHLRSAASLAGTKLPAADAYCLAVLSKLDRNPPDVYFSPEQHVRVLLGRFVRSLYDLGPDSFENGRIPNGISTQFGELRNAVRALPEKSWLVKLYGPRLRLWESVLSGENVPDADLEPLFRRIRTGGSRGKQPQDGSSNTSVGTTSASGSISNPFGVPTRAAAEEDF